MKRVEDALQSWWFCITYVNFGLPIRLESASGNARFGGLDHQSPLVPDRNGTHYRYTQSGGIETRDGIVTRHGPV